jgi:hypothetical protein
MTKREKKRVRKYLDWLIEPEGTRFSDAIYQLGKLAGRDYPGLKRTNKKNIKVYRIDDLTKNQKFIPPKRNK